MSADTDGLLAEQLTQCLPDAVAGAAQVLDGILDGVCSSGSRTIETALESLDANFASMTRMIAEPDGSADPVLPRGALWWPREIAAGGLPESVVFRGYVACGEYWWRECVLPEILEVCDDRRHEALETIRRTSMITFLYVREVGEQAAREYRRSRNSAGGGAPGGEPILEVLTRSADAEQLSGLVTDRLSMFDLDDGVDKNLVKTTLQWFDSMCCSLVAARRLRIHRNTLQYRLRKVEEMLGRPLEKDRFETELAMRIAVKRRGCDHDGH